MAFEGIIGVLILFNVCTKASAMFLRAAKAGSYDATFWEAIVADLVMALIAIALVADAFRVRRHLRALDAKIEEPKEA